VWLWDLASLTCIAELEASHQVCLACHAITKGFHIVGVCCAAVGPGQPDVHRRSCGDTRCALHASIVFYFRYVWTQTLRHAARCYSPSTAEHAVMLREAWPAWRALQCWMHHTRCACLFGWQWLQSLVLLACIHSKAGLSCGSPYLGGHCAWTLNRAPGSTIIDRCPTHYVLLTFCR
jgi:hypothetical protein